MLLSISSRIFPLYGAVNSTCRRSYRISREISVRYLTSRSSTISAPKYSPFSTFTAPSLPRSIASTSLAFGAKETVHERKNARTHVPKCWSFSTFTAPSLRRSIASTSLVFGAKETVHERKTNVSKRGPKFRTPSKIKEAATAFDEAEERLPEWNIWAYATAEDYYMKLLSRSVKVDGDYELRTVAKDLPDVFRLTPPSKVDQEHDRREIFVFSNGAVVFWNVHAEERANFLRRLRPFERIPFDPSLVEEECERLVYVLNDYEEENGVTAAEKATEKAMEAGNGRRGDEIKSGKFRKEVLYLDAMGTGSQQQLLERYTVSNVIAASVQLAMWEADLDDLAARLEEVTQAMNKGRISMNKTLAISYAGRLLSLRHNVSLHSDLLDHPDFYWERTGLEKLYDQASEIFCIRRRVNVFNKKIDDAMTLINVIMQELAVNHSARLEWLIIWLILVEVVFDVYHFWRTL